jgi:IrrE N-terminal-like domain
LAPIIVRRKDEDDAEDSGARKAVFFRVVYIFDIGDTTGEPLKTLELPPADSDNGFLPCFEAAIKSLGIEVEYKELPDPNMFGYSTGGKIVVREGLPAGETVSVLAHELGHELLHWGEYKEMAKEMGKQAREIEAEATAFAVLAHLGIESSAHLYLTSYGVDGKAIKSALSRVREAVVKIVDAIETARKDATTPESPAESLALAA